MNAYAIATGVLICILGILLWRYNRKSIQNALHKRELNNQIDAVIRNQNANRKKQERDQKRKKLLSTPVDPDDPWRGVRKS